MRSFDGWAMATLNVEQTDETFRQVYAQMLVELQTPMRNLHERIDLVIQQIEAIRPQFQHAIAV